MEAMQEQLNKLTADLAEEKRLRSEAVQALQREGRGQEAAAGQESNYLRTLPPSLDTTDNFHIWEKNLNVWEAGGGRGLSDTAKAAVIMEGITDHHKGHKLGLKSLMMEMFTDEQTKKPTMKMVKDFLREQLVYDQYDEMHRLWRSFIGCEIRPGERWAEFVTRFDTRWEALRQKDPDLKIPDKILVLLLRDNSKLSSANLMGLRTNVPWDSQDLYTKTKTVINQICASEKYCPGGMAQVKLVTADGDDEIGYQDGCYYINGTAVTTREELYAVEGKADKKPRKKKVCWNCGEAGHFSSDCKKKKKEDGGRKWDRKSSKPGKKTKKTVTFESDTSEAEEDNNYMEEYERQELLMFETEDEEEDLDLVPSDHNYGSKALLRSDGTSYSGTSSHNNQYRANSCSPEENHTFIDLTENDDDEEDCYINIGPKKVKSFRAEARGAAGLDTCCSRTVCGESWLQDFVKLLPRDMKKEMKGPIRSTLSFKFGDDKHLSSLGKYKLPVEINGVRVKLLVEVVSSDIPLLLSKTTMSRAGTVIDLEGRTVTMFGIKKNLKETIMGHPIISVTPIKRDPIITDQVLTLEVGEKVETSDEQQRKDIRKLHKQAGHPSKAKMRDFLKKGSRKWNKKLVDEELDYIAKNCLGCQMKKNTPSKPVACIPVADGFNQVVGVDLRIKGDGLIILYIIDIWSKLMAARVVKSKKSEDIVKAMLEAWVSIYGCPDGFLHDNGGEFIGAAWVEMADLMGAVDKTTGAHSPWSAGVVERHHAVVDACLDSLIQDYPSYSVDTLLAWAIMIKNSQVSNKGWSPFQVVFGRNPSLPNLMDSPISAMTEETTSYALKKNMDSLAAARTRFNEALCDVRVAKMLKSKVRRNQVVFQAGDRIVWRAHHTGHKWERGKVLAADGKLLFVRKGGQIYRVSADMALPEGKEFDKNGTLVSEEGKVEIEKEKERPEVTTKKMQEKKHFEYVTIVPRRRSQRLASQEEQRLGADRVRQGGGEGAGPVPGPVPASPGRNYDTPVLHGPGEAPHPGTSSVVDKTSPDDNIPHDVTDHANNSTDAEEDEVFEEEQQVVERTRGDHSALLDQNHGAQASHRSSGVPSPGESQSQVATDSNTQSHGTPDPGFNVDYDMHEESDLDRRQQMRTIVYNEMNDAKKRKAAESPPTTVRKARKIPRPACTGRKLSVKAGELIQTADPEGQMKICKVLSREKVNGRYYNRFNLEPQDGSKPYNVDLGRAAWHRWRDSNTDGGEDLLLMNGTEAEVHMNLIPFREHGNQECMEAKRVELKKIVEEFKAVKVVDDVGQFRISSRFVLWHKKHSTGEVQTRARLVCRGFEESDMGIISDSPTLDHSSFKIIFAIAQAKNMEIESVDVKSAFLQGTPFTDKDRVVTVRPPPEAGLPKGKLWQLLISLYGLDDASYRFFVKTRTVFKKLGLRQSKYDPSLFLDKTKDGEIRGMIGTHVDDFLLAGNRKWLDDIIKRIKENFLLGKVESGSYLYCGHRIRSKDGQVTIDQREYVNDIKPLVIPPGRKSDNAASVTEQEKKIIRSYAGKLGWLGRTTRPDLLFAQVEASSTITRATVGNLKDLAKAVGRIREQDSVQVVPKLKEDVTKWKLLCYSDAAWQNLDVVGSTAGRVMILTDGIKSYPIYWGTNRLRRVCHSSQQAEIMAANTAVGEAAYLVAVIEEITGDKIRTELFIDNKNAFAAVTSTTAPTDKKVRREAAGIREALMVGEVKKITLVSTDKQLADSLTKKKSNGANLLHLIQTGGGQEGELGH